MTLNQGVCVCQHSVSFGRAARTAWPRVGPGRSDEWRRSTAESAPAEEDYISLLNELDRNLTAE